MSEPQPEPHTSSTTTRSTCSDEISYTPCDGSICSLPPRVSASREPEDAASSTSSLNDPILKHFALRRLSGSPTTSPIRRSTRQGSSASSVDGTGSEETSSQTTGLNIEQNSARGTPATSDTSDDTGTDFGHDQDPYDPEARVADRESVLLGLDLPTEFQDEPIFYDISDERNDPDIFENATEFNEHIKWQGRHDARPWTLCAEDFEWLKSDRPALAPSPGLGYNAHYLKLRNYTRRHQKNQQQQRRLKLRDGKTQPTYSGFRDEPPTEIPDCRQDIVPYALAQLLLTNIEPRAKRSKTWHIGQVSRIYQQQSIRRSVDCVTLSPETLVSIFHPSFLVAHLSRSELAILTTSLYAPKDFVHGTEHEVNLSLGFGQPIPLDVCTFKPRDKTALRSYQKHEGKEELQAQESLPIAINLFSIESHAEGLDAWLDQVLDSDDGIPEYLSLMLDRQKEDYASQLLEVLVDWYTTLKDKNIQPSKPARQIFPLALKLLITTTLLTLVPKIDSLPTSLSDYLSSPSTTTAAPRLLTRQIKASIYHLQKDFLRALFDQFTDPVKLEADFKIAVAFLVAYVLDLVRRDGQQFAKFLRVFNPSMVVTEQDVVGYETDLQSALFERIRASVPGVAGRRRAGGLGEGFRRFAEIRKGKEKQNGEYRFVSAILDAIL